MFEEKIIASSTTKLSKLFNPARKASEKPDTGIEIKNKAAYFVIRDCAALAKDYIPLAILSEFPDPFTTLKSAKITKEEILDFVKRASAGNVPTVNLLEKILNIFNIHLNETKIDANTPTKIDESAYSDDVYNEYVSLSESPVSLEKEALSAKISVKSIVGMSKIKENEAFIISSLENELCK